MCESANMKVSFIDKEIHKEIKLKPETLVDFELIQISGGHDKLFER